MIIFIYFLLLGNLTQTIDMNIFSEGNEDTLQDQCLKTLQNSNSIPDVSEEVRANIADTLTGFTGGFLKNNGQKNDAMHYYAESSQMAVGFGTSEIRYPSPVLP